MGGLQAQYAPAMYVGLWSRVEGFRREALTRALEQRRLVQATLMRATIHLVSVADYWLMEVGCRDWRRDHWRRAARHAVGDGEMRAAARRPRERLRAGPLRRAEIEEELGRERAQRVGMWLSLVRVPPSGAVDRRRAHLYAATEDWVGPPQVTPEAGLEHLVRRYLGGFGPAPRADIADWAGVPPAGARQHARGPAAASLPRRARRRAARPPPRPPAACRHCGSRPLPSRVGRQPTRSTPSWWMARWPGPGGTKRATSPSIPSTG